MAGIDPVSAGLGVAELGFGAYNTYQANKQRRLERQAALQAEQARFQQLQLSPEDIARENQLAQFGQTSLAGQLSPADIQAQDRARRLTEFRQTQAEGNQLRNLQEGQARRGLAGSPAGIGAASDLAQQNLARRQALQFERENADMANRSRLQSQGVNVLSGVQSRAAAQRNALAGAVPGSVEAQLAGREASSAEEAAGTAFGQGTQRLVEAYKNRKPKAPTFAGTTTDKRNKTSSRRVEPLLPEYPSGSR